MQFKQMLRSLKLIQPVACGMNGMNLDSSYARNGNIMWYDDTLVQELASGAVLLGLRAPA